ncbi:MAG: hypothetical protein ABMA13_09990 [Chthoniobacteraceae bacterium]
MKYPTIKSAIIATAALAFLAQPTAEAGQRRYVYSYETLTAPKGSKEYEQWVTWRHRDIQGGDDRDRWEFRHEFEFGLTERLQLGIYVADWQYDEDDSEGHEFRFQKSGFDLIYNLTNPNTDLIGSALYGEFLVGEDLIKTEFKLLLEKRFGRLGIVYNAILEAEWEGGEYHDETGEFIQTFGVSYDLSKSVSVGVEARHVIEMPDWENTEPAVFYVGPNVSYRHGRYFATLAWLWQTTHLEGESDFQTRMIVGFDF